MKTLRKVTTYIVVAVLSLSIYSCGDDDEETKGSVTELIGIWEGVTEDEWVVEEGEREENYGKDISDERYELKSDMTFNALRKHNTTWSTIETGKWELTKNTLKLIFYYPNDGGYDEEDPDIWEILDISKSAMTWESHLKEPGFELYSKQTLRRITD